MREPASDEYLRAHTIGELKPISGPIRIVDYDAAWPFAFEHAADKIRSALGNRALCIEHTGSTSVPGLPAKPIIDIVLAVPDSAAEAEYVPGLEGAGYQLRIRESGWYEHRMLKGLDPEVNLHVFSAGCLEIERMLAFRDWLRISASDRVLYARSKRDLAQQNWKYTRNYAAAKAGVIEEILSRSLPPGNCAKFKSS